MKSTILAFLSIFTICLISCNNTTYNNEIDNDDYFVFGSFYGECDGYYCIQTYKLTANKLFKDTSNTYAGIDNESLVIEPNVSFQNVEHLSAYLPEKLINSADSTFGCPDCVDQGGLFIQWYKDGKLHTWLIDQDKNNIPEYLHDFVDLINNKIDNLRAVPVLFD